MGMRVNLVDRAIYNLEPDTEASSSENYLKKLNDLQQTLLSEKDKFILSEKDSFEMLNSLPEAGKAMGYGAAEREKHASLVQQ